MEKPHLAVHPPRVVIDMPHKKMFDIACNHNFLYDRGSNGAPYNNNILLMAKNAGVQGTPTREFLMHASKSMNLLDMRNRRELVKTLSLEQNNMENDSKDREIHL